MYLLYADESGALHDPGQRFFVLAGVAVFERSTHYIELELNKIASRFCPDNPHLFELHGSPMRTGAKEWRNFGREQRLDAIRDALLTGVARQNARNVRLFAAVLEKANYSGQDIVQVAFEQLSSRFDQFLGRLYKANPENKQRGLILFDESATEGRIQTLAREFKFTGHSFGVTRNYAEVPVFLDSKASRLIQLADLVAYATFRFYEHNDDTYFRHIRSCFDHEGEVVHGLYVRS